MALSAAADINVRQNGNPMYGDFVVNSGSQIYAGALVCFEASGDEIVPAADTSGFRFAGLAEETVLGDGTKRCRVTWNVEARLPRAAAITAADVGANAVAAADDQVTDAGAATNDVVVGTIKELDGSTHAWVFLDPTA